MSSQGGKAGRRARGSPRSRRGRWIRLALVLLFALALALGAGGAYFINLDLPDIRALEGYRPATPTRLLAADGSIIHQFGVERRTLITYAEIPEVLRDAIVATEDASFFRHLGVDPLGIARAAVKDILKMRKAEGASTLTQQLTRGLFLGADKTFERKIREAVLAIQIEKTYTKEEIFTFYCNQIYMGHGRYGVEAAAQHYFSRRALELTLPQAALLAGMIQLPERISPLRNPDLALRRRNHVLKRMLQEGYVDARTSEEAMAQPLGLAPETPGEEIAAYFVEEVRRDLDARLGQEALYRQGLTIQTALDLDLQRAAESALDRGVREIAKRRAFRLPASNILREKKGALTTYFHPGWGKPLEPGAIATGLILEVDGRRALVRLGDRRFEIGPGAVTWTGRGALDRIFRPGDLAPFLVLRGEDGALSLELSAEPRCEGAVLALDPATGAIRTLVGGLDFSRSQFDRAIQAERQPGSAFKPILYAAALEEGWTASDPLLDEPTVFVDPQTGVPYQPENYYRDYNGVVTVRYALEHSLNIATVRMLNLLGYQRAVDQARRMGITSKLRPYPALGLGASEVSLMDLTTAYATFANLGTLVRPRLHTRILGSDGAVLEEAKPEGADVPRPEIAYLMTSLLKGVIARGTATDARSLGEAIAGKTGTTDDNTDAWFIGYSPSLVLGVWVGKDDKEPLGVNETGARAALPVWIDIMKSYLAAHPDEVFRRPSGIETYAVDARTGLKAAVDTDCQDVILEDFRRGAPAPALCSRHAHLRARLPYYLQRYPWLDEETLALTREDLDRLLRDAPREISVEGRHTLIAQGVEGEIRLPFRVVPADDPDVVSVAGSAALWGAPGGRADAGGAANVFFGLAFPPDLAPVIGEAASHPTLGLDGRTTAVITVRYP